MSARTLKDLGPNLVHDDDDPNGPFRYKELDSTPLDAIDAVTIDVEQQTFGELDEGDEQEPRTLPVVNRARRCFHPSCNKSATTLVGSFGGIHHEEYGTHGAVTLVWRCNNCTVVMHNDILNLRYDRRQAPGLIDRLSGPVNGDPTGESTHPMDGIALTSGIDVNFVEIIL